MTERIDTGWSYLLHYGELEIPFSEGDVVLGRGRASGVRIEEDSVSRSHAMLSVKAGKVTVRDLGSSNGLFVNGRRAGKEEQLHNGDTLGLGNAKLSVTILPPPDLEMKTAMINPREILASPPPENATQFIRPTVVMATSPGEVMIRDDVPERRETTKSGKIRIEPAPLLPRFLSGLVDLAVAAAIVLVCLIPALVATLAHSSLKDRGAAGGPFYWILLLFCGGVALSGVAVYFLSGWSGRGATFGQRVFKLRLASEDGGFVRSSAVLARLGGVLLCFASAGLLFLLVFFDKERRGLPDKLSHSRTVRD
jgi:uncharacterized RDD family membrane protein YckC